jgi:L-fuconolactonase
MSKEIVPSGKRRFVDSHVHLWDPGNMWYRFPKPGEDNYGLGDVSRFPTVFGLNNYREALSSVNVVKFVHVNATENAEGAYKETRWLAEMSRHHGVPNAIISTVDTGKALTELESVFDSQMITPLYRGIRLLHGLDYASEYGRGLLDMLSDRKLVYDVVAHPGGGIVDAARAAARHPKLVFVLEHTGWPLQTDNAHWNAWKAEIAEFAAIPSTICKLSGLGMTYHRTDPDIFQRHWNHCLELFGAQRCMFGSNFPVDSLYGTFDDLLAVFENTARSLSANDQAAVFGDTAERVYRL